MSTYNSERFIKQQIDSILVQNDVSLSLCVRDDGSKDKTISILKQYANTNPNFSYYIDGENLRSARSFMQMLKNSSDDAEYYAFSDHDDYWKPEKLSVAVECLRKYGDSKPALYFCQTQLVDQDLQPIPSVIINPHLTFGESLVYEFIGGCTMVMNKALRDIINKFNPDYIPMHDVWIYSVALAVGGAIVFDPVPHILYRQHSGNVIGQGKGILHEWKRRADRLINKEHSRSRRALNILNGYRDIITPENLETLNLFVKARHSFSKRIKLIFDNRFSSANHTTNLLFKLSVLLNIY